MPQRASTTWIGVVRREGSARPRPAPSGRRARLQATTVSPPRLLLEDAVEVTERNAVGGGDHRGHQVRIVQVLPDERPDASRQRVRTGLRRQGGLGLQRVGEPGRQQIEYDRAQPWRVGRLLEVGLPLQDGEEVRRQSAQPFPPGERPPSDSRTWCGGSGSSALGESTPTPLMTPAA